DFVILRRLLRAAIGPADGGCTCNGARGGCGCSGCSTSGPCRLGGCRSSASRRLRDPRGRRLVGQRTRDALAARAVLSEGLRSLLAADNLTVGFVSLVSFLGHCHIHLRYEPRAHPPPHDEAGEERQDQPAAV